ncbi:MAG TPA: acyl-CoA synthetase FdrA [Thermoanaerobaculia bacterium]|nr:acyl-CoA synthetase FdrA [Thermoanaerobaculia bacterium]
MNPEPITRCVVRAGSYHDSIVLMRLQRALAALPGVIDAGVIMATPANRDLLAAGGFDLSTAANPDDLLVAVKAESETVAAEALSRIDALLKIRAADSSEDYRPHSLAAAFKQLPEARWVLVSVPGRYAADVAGEALEQGRNVFLYSDNVPIEREVDLKRRARDKGLLVLGPDCGTAWLGGIGLGFANRVRRGNIGLVGASGTGLQAVMSRIHALDGGISQAIGTGGRDLSAEVGGITAGQALDLLRRDPETKVIVLIAKPPAPEVASRLLAQARATGKPVVVHFLGAPLPGRRLGNVSFAATLSEAAELAVAAFPGSAGVPPALTKTELAAGGTPALPGKTTYVRGLFSGGTLAYEALLGLSAFLTPVWSNLGGWRLDDPLRSREHTILDLGADEFTVGRLHPMIDQDLRLRRLRQEAADPEVGLILLDVVLGEGAHADPAGELAPHIAEARRNVEVAAIVIGTDADPQDLETQISTLESAGARVFRTVTDAVDWIFLRTPSHIDMTSVPLESVQSMAAINVGLESFHDSLRSQGAASVHVDWRPPAGGNERLAGILARMKG